MAGSFAAVVARSAGAVVALAACTLVGLASLALGAHAQGDALAGGIDLKHGDEHALMDLDHLCGVLDELVRQLADMDQPVLVHADVHEGSEGCDIGHDAGELEPFLEVGNLVNALGEAEGLELFARVTARLGKLLLDVLQGGQADLVAEVLVEIDAAPGGIAGEKLTDGAAGVGGHLLDQLVALGVDGGGVERVLAVADTQEARALLEAFRAHAGNLQQLFA